MVFSSLKIPLSPFLFLSLSPFSFLPLSLSFSTSLSRFSLSTSLSPFSLYTPLSLSLFSFYPFLSLFLPLSLLFYLSHSLSLPLSLSTFSLSSSSSPSLSLFFIHFVLEIRVFSVWPKISIDLTLCYFTTVDNFLITDRNTSFVNFETLSQSYPGLCNLCKGH